MAISGIITNEGLNKSIQAQANDGWFIYPTSFSVSTIAGTLDANRTIGTINTEWYTANISSRVVIAPNSIEFICSIPPGAVSSLTDINEIYLFAKDQTNVEFLLAIGQPGVPITYDPSGTLTLRLMITLSNVDIGATYNFLYTQATEISEHDNDPNAHDGTGNIQPAINKAGIFVQASQHSYLGQYWDEKAVFDASVTHEMLVYRNSTDDKYYPAIADGTEKAKVIGIADLNRNYVITSGLIDTALSFTANKDIFLSSTTPGTIVDTNTPVKVGLHINNGLLLLGTQGGIGGTGDISSEDVLYQTLLYSSSFGEVYYDIFNVPSTVTLGGTPVPVFDAVNTGYTVDSGSQISHEVYNGTSLTRFFIHVEEDTAVGTTVEYSINDAMGGGGIWNPTIVGDTITVPSGFTQLQIRLSSNGAGKIYSFGVLYNFQNTSLATDTRMFEVVTMPTNEVAPYQITLPNNALYTTDSKSLEIYLNRARLVPGVDYTEIDNKTVEFNVNLAIGDTIVFIEKFAYIDSTLENKTRLDLEHTAIGEHIYQDATTGINYKFGVDNGNVILIEQ